MADLSGRANQPLSQKCTHVPHVKARKQQIGKKEKLWINFGMKELAAPLVGFHCKLSQDPKDFLDGTNEEGGTFHSKFLYFDFMCAFTKKWSKTRKNVPVNVVAMDNW